MVRLAIFLAGLVLASCGGPAPYDAKTEQSKRPTRIVSLDYCADQFVLKLVDKDRILAVSPGAASDFSYMRATAVGMPTVRSSAEDVLILQPDLVVRSYGGGPNAATFFERAGIAVLNIGWTPDIPAVITNIETVAEGLGEPGRGAVLTAEMQTRLDAIAADNTGKRALYMTPSGVTSGPGSLVHEMLLAAGLQNYQAEPGWHPIPLEQLVYDDPDLIAAAFFDTEKNQFDAWGAMNHPVAQAQLKGHETARLQGAWTTCGGWFLVDAIEALAASAKQ